MDYQSKYEESMRLVMQRIRESVQPDSLIVQCVGAVDDVDRAAGVLAKRLREWYELENPELSRQIQDHEAFARALAAGSDTKQQDSMGAELSREDDKPIRLLAEQLSSLYGLRASLEQYIESVMCSFCSNTLAVAGPMVGARLLAHSGSLKRLSSLTASTVQLLGAEKALFRHMRTGARPPKHGIILMHPLLQKAAPKDRGRAARALADKISIAAKVDYFKGAFIGDELKAQLERKLAR